jgi:predicted nucleic acid-binding protein
VRTALDTNLLVYAEGVNGEPRRTDALRILDALPADYVLIPTQVLGELFTVLTRKAGRSAAASRQAVLEWTDGYATIDTTQSVLLEAMEIATTHHLSLWDSMMLAAAAQAGCRIVLSEDMQDGFTWRGVTIRNPFAQPPA